MRASLVVTNLGLAAAGFVWVEILRYRLDTSPDAESVILGAVWLGFPYLAAAALAGLARRHPAAQITLLVTLVVAGGIGLYLLTGVTVEHERSRHEVATAVNPGEDPNRGAAGMRRSGAEAAEVFTGALSLVMCVVVPPVQFAVTTIPTLIAWAVSALARGARRGTAGLGNARTTPV